MKKQHVGNSIIVAVEPESAALAATVAALLPVAADNARKRSIAHEKVHYGTRICPGCGGMKTKKARRCKPCNYKLRSAVIEDRRTRGLPPLGNTHTKDIPNAGAYAQPLPEDVNHSLNGSRRVRGEGTRRPLKPWVWYDLTTGGTNEPGAADDPAGAGDGAH